MKIQYIHKVYISFFIIISALGLTPYLTLSFWSFWYLFIFGVVWLLAFLFAVSRYKVKAYIWIPIILIALIPSVLYCGAFIVFRFIRFAP
jgi:hypothetical protein